MKINDLFAKKNMFLIIPVSIILGLIIAVQYRSVNNELFQGTDSISASRSYAREFTELQQQNELLVQQIDDLQAQIASYQNVDSADGTLEALSEEVNLYKKLGGFTAVTGEGIVVDFNSSEQNPNLGALQRHILSLINELNAAGAEAIAVNEQRVINSTEIRHAGNVLMVNNVQIAPPYIIKVIGHSETLDAALNMRFGFIEMVRAGGYFIESRKHENVEIQAYPGRPIYNYAETIR